MEKLAARSPPPDGMYHDTLGESRDLAEGSPEGLRRFRGRASRQPLVSWQSPVFPLHRSGAAACAIHARLGLPSPNGCAEFHRSPVPGLLSPRTLSLCGSFSPPRPLRASMRSLAPAAEHPVTALVGQPLEVAAVGVHRVNLIVRVTKPGKSGLSHAILPFSPGNAAQAGALATPEAARTARASSPVRFSNLHAQRSGPVHVPVPAGSRRATVHLAADCQPLASHNIIDEFFGLRRSLGVLEMLG